MDNEEHDRQLQLLEGQEGAQQQLYHLARWLRHLGERLTSQASQLDDLTRQLKAHIEKQEQQHKDNLGRLDKLEGVVIEGVDGGEVSLVRRVDAVMSALEGMRTVLDRVAGVADTIAEWKGVKKERDRQEEKRRWKIGDVWIPLVCLLGGGAVAELSHWLFRK